MFVLRTLAASALTLGTMIAAAAPAQAVVTTFAQYEAIGTASNVRWVNSAGPVNGTGGSLFTIPTGTSTVAASRNVSFSFLQPSISPFVTNVVAAFSLSATVPSGNPATLAGGFLIQSGISGTFSFLTTTSLTIGANTFAAGSNLLTGTFTSAAIAGGRSTSTGQFSGGTVTYTSDFLDFDPASANAFGINLTSIASILQAAPTSGTPNKALRSFKALSTGSFSSDPAPTVTAVPEPAVWGLMIVGFGMVGIQARRRARNGVAA